MNKEDLKTFKKRFLGCILATDMAKHAEDLARIKQRLEIIGVKSDLANANLLLDKTNGKSIFDTQQ